MLPAEDELRLRQAYDLAVEAVGLTEPNPRVGCVLASASGQVVGTGHTQQAGGGHAEAMALRAVVATGADIKGGTAWVTLEPCSHHGRTPPCCEALIAAGLARVVVACGDPNPLVAGRGLAALRLAGIQVDLVEGEMGKASRELNIGFFSRMIRKRPWVRMKVAASLDGVTALSNGESQWITGPLARADGHAWRRRASAVLTGVGTVCADDPRLDVRLVPTASQPLRVVVDSRLQMPLTSRLLAPPGQVLVATAIADPDRCAGLLALGAQVNELPAEDGHVHLPSLMDHLAERGINEVHVEAGATLNGALLEAGLVDELVIYLGPCLIGPGRAMAALGPLQRLSDQIALQFTDLQTLGSDLRIVARVQGRDDFLQARV